jgi:hypothetical protein
MFFLLWHIVLNFIYLLHRWSSSTGQENVIFCTDPILPFFHHVQVWHQWWQVLNVYRDTCGYQKCCHIICTALFQGICVFQRCSNIFQGNANEMPVYFYMSSTYTIDDDGATFEVTVMLIELTDSSLLLPYVILNWKSVPKTQLATYEANNHASNYWTDK